MDGIVADPALLLALNASGAGCVGLALQRVQRRPQRSLAWAGTLGAFVLAAQAINVPVGPGVSAHVIGSGLLTLVLGPALSILALACVLMIQALLLGDGGISMLGANVINIAVLPAIAMHLARRCLGPKAGATAVVGTVLGSVLGALSLAWMLAYGAGAPWRVTCLWLVGVQGVAGLVEGVLTLIALGHLARRAPGLLDPDQARLPTLDDAIEAPVPRPGLRWTALGLGLLLAWVPFASGSPDALEVVVQRLQDAP